MEGIEYVASVDEFQNALINLPRNERFDRWCNLLAAHYNLHEHKATTRELSAILHRSYGGIIPSYGHLGSRILDRLPKQMQEIVAGELGRKIDVLVLSDINENGDLVWAMRPEVASALEQLGWVDKRASVESADGSTIQHDGLVTTSDLDENWNAILRALPDFAEESELVGMIEKLETTPLVQDDNRVSSQKTTVKALIMARFGQGRYRRDLMGVWNGQCAVTQIAADWLLRASHMKPWKYSSDEERLDPYNGLPLTPTLDLAFDRGHITFTDSGEIIIAANQASNLARLGIHPSMRLSKVHEKNLNYLAYHRKHIFEDNQ